MVEFRTYLAIRILLNLDYRHMQKLLIIYAILFSAGYNFLMAKEKKPNIILIVADDLGIKDVGFMGGTFFETPNLNKLAASGKVFTNAYASAANCAPSRASMMTGLTQSRHGVYTVGSSERGNAKLRKIIPTKNTPYVAESFVLLPEALKAKGYTTMHLGKWHVSKDPLTQGFDFNIGGTGAGHPKSYFAPFEGLPNLKGDFENQNLTDKLTDEAIRLIEEHKDADKPFFMNLSFFAVHTPLQGKKDLVQKYTNKEGNNDMRYHPVLGALIENLDANVGKLLSYLEESKLDENTLIIFTSDNGGIRAFSPQTPWRAGKGSYYEGGTRVPLVFSWKGKIKAGTSSGAKVSNIDFYPTITDVADIKTSISSDGQSLKKHVLNGKKLKKRDLYWHFPIYLQAYDMIKDEGKDPYFRTRPGSTIVSGNWKLHEYFEDGDFELYNLSDNPSERIDLSEKYPKIVKKLSEKLADWRASVQAPRPKEANPKYQESFKPKKRTKRVNP